MVYFEHKHRVDVMDAKNGELLSSFYGDNAEDEARAYCITKRFGSDFEDIPTLVEMIREHDRAASANGGALVFRASREECIEAVRSFLEKVRIVNHMGKSDAEKISAMLLDCAEFFAATLAVADVESWDLLTYAPRHILVKAMER